MRAEADVLPEVGHVAVSDIGPVLKAGFTDFLKAPAFGLFFSAIYVAGGIIIYLVYTAAGQEWWLIPVIVGFPILAPFAAVGLYEVSRRIEAGEPLVWREVLGVVFSQKDRQIPSMAMVILLMFMFWVFVAHTIFALFMGLSAMTNVTSSFALLLEGNGPVMLHCRLCHRGGLRGGSLLDHRRRSATASRPGGRFRVGDDPVGAVR